MAVSTVANIVYSLIIIIYIAPYAELRRRWTAVNQAAVNKNVFRCFLKTESELQSRMFDGRLFQITAGAASSRLGDLAIIESTVSKQ